jgi:predicted alpha/beta superfamily hydrolase
MNHQLFEKVLTSKSLKRNLLVHIALPTRIDGPLQGIFFNDGQNVWDDEQASFGVSWGLKDAIDFNQHQICVVSVSCAPGLDRLDEYSKFVDESIVGKADWIDRACGGKADLYLKEVVEVILPFANTFASLKPSWLMVGSSMGGVISLTAMVEYPHIFTKIAGLSNAFWFAQKQFLDYVTHAELSLNHHVYCDVGTLESGIESENSVYINSNVDVVQALLKKPLGSLTFVRVVDGKHHESDWSKRIGSILVEMLKR